MDEPVGPAAGDSDLPDAGPDTPGDRAAAGQRGRRLALVTGGLIAAAAAWLVLEPPGGPPSRSAALTSTPWAAASESGAARLSPTPTSLRTPSPTGVTGPRPTLRPAGSALAALRGAVIAVDPGHDGGNALDPTALNRLVDIGNATKACDTVGTQTDAGYPEHAFTWDVATRLAAILRSAGARVVFTRSSDAGFGPCISQRAAIGNRAHADAALSIHADGGPPGGRGFHVIEPGAIGLHDGMVAPSRRLGAALVSAFHTGTGEPYSTYTGTRGVTVRTDLGGLNLSSVPKVFIECANMRNAGDARLLTDPGWRQQAAAAIALGLARYLSSR